MNANKIYNLAKELRNSRFENGKSVVEIENFKNFIQGHNVGLTKGEANKIADEFSIRPVGAFKGRDNLLDLQKLQDALLD